MYFGGKLHFMHVQYDSMCGNEYVSERSALPPAVCVRGRERDRDRVGM